MTAAQRKLLRLVRARTRRNEPDVRAAYLRSIRLLQSALSDEQIAARITSGLYDDIFSPAVMARALQPYEQALRKATEDGFRLAVGDIPNAVGLRFDYLNPRVVTAIRTMESRALGTLAANVRGSVRVAVEAGLQAGKHPTAIARGLRDVIGLAPNQARYVVNLRAQLATLDPAALDRKLLNKRHVAMIERRIAEGKPLTVKEINTIAGAYEKKWVATNTVTNTRQATIDSYRVAKRESYASAIQQGIIPAGRAMKRWLHLDPQDNPRPEHQRMHGTVVPFDQPYPTPERHMSAGEGDYGCYCSDQYFLAPA